MSKYALVAVAGLAITAGASAGLGGWTWTFMDTASGSGTANDAGLNITGGDANIAGSTWFETTAGADQTIDFTALYTSSDTGAFDQAFYFINDALNNFVTFAQNDTNNGVTQNLSFNVLAGDTFGFGVLTQDGAFGPGSLNVSAISPPVPTPGALSLLGIAGLAAARRRRR